MQKASRQWHRIYAKVLNMAIESADRKLFEFLVSNPLEPLERPSFKRRTLAFYETFRDEHTIAAMEVIREDLRLEEQSAAFLSTERAAFRKNQQVLAQEAVEQSDLPVLVSTKREDGHFVFYAQNRNVYPITLTLELPSINNFTPSDRLPRVVELAPGSKQKVLVLEIDDRRKKASFTSRYSWVMGRLSARHSDPLYNLPFAAGSRVFVSQGVDGGVTHKGLTRYAVDFQCPVGTKIYAARDGRVVAAESSHNKGGFDKSFGDQANYIIIEHDDHTLCKYYHLKQYGVMVRVGEYVHAGEFIGYSGNTGYSSGPHLHFSVSSVDSASKNLPITLPFRFKTANGIVNTPKTRDIYTAVKVR
jgi:murein DD-endopeptidase MepM/ murein hydrolase activator NlpD